MIYAESYVKQFCKSFEKCTEAIQTLSIDYCKEKLLLCMYIINRRTMDVDTLLDKKGYVYQGLQLSNDETNFLSKTLYPKNYI